MPGGGGGGVHSRSQLAYLLKGKHHCFKDRCVPRILRRVKTRNVLAAFPAAALSFFSVYQAATITSPFSLLPVALLPNTQQWWWVGVCNSEGEQGRMAACLAATPCLAGGGGGVGREEGGSSSILCPRDVQRIMAVPYCLPWWGPSTDLDWWLTTDPCPSLRMSWASSNLPEKEVQRHFCGLLSKQFRYSVDCM